MLPAIVSPSPANMYAVESTKDAEASHSIETPVPGSMSNVFLKLYTFSIREHLMKCSEVFINIYAL